MLQNTFVLSPNPPLANISPEKDAVGNAGLFASPVSTGRGIRRGE
jgi:hypothetical protein